MEHRYGYCVFKVIQIVPQTQSIISAVVTGDFHQNDIQTDNSIELKKKNR